jgi:hypothetical protein
LLEKSGPICHAAVKGMLRTKPKDKRAIATESFIFRAVSLVE